MPGEPGVRPATGPSPAPGSRGRVSLRWLAALLTAQVLLLAACGGEASGPPVTVQGGESDDGLHGVVLDEPYQVPRQLLVDTAGERTRLTAQQTDLRLVFFGYTNCPDICGVVMGSLASAMTRLDPADRERVDVVFVTTDPARDDPATLRDYLDRYDPAFSGLTGDLDQIIRMARRMGVGVEQSDRLPSGGYDVTHGTQVIGLRPDGTAPVVWTETTSAAKFAEDLHALLAEGSEGTA